MSTVTVPDHDIESVDPEPDYGEVFTRRWVVEFILDLVGYTPDRDLGSLVLVEPACGTGAFLAVIVERLLASCSRHGRNIRSCTSAIRAFEFVESNAAVARKVVSEVLQQAGLPVDEAERLANGWIVAGDFLLHDDENLVADVVVGNPPYIRAARIDPERLAQYQQRCPTMRGRSDIYVGFLERGLSILTPGGRLGYICADRWMRNQYGSRIREFIARSYSVNTVVAMHDVDAFDDEVSAYPAIVVIERGEQGDAVVVETKPGFEEADVGDVLEWVRSSHGAPVTPRFDASRADKWFEGPDFWPSGSPARIAFLSHLAHHFPALADDATGTKVGIGVASGCDEVYITSDRNLVEQSRLLPIVNAAETADGLSWAGRYLVNPWDDDGLVDLNDYPRLKAYFHLHEQRLRGRHVAKQRSAQWFRTIDKVDPGLATRPKILLPDLKASAHPVLDEGTVYPHNSLYYIVSDQWDLEVLGGLLLSQVTDLFVGAYCVRMRGGCYRFQAQYVRRIPVPPLDSIEEGDRRSLAVAFTNRDVDSATDVALRLFGIDPEEFAAVRG